jgi:dTDP-4-amino-4,6-dideoxygalactose transaminase
MSFHGTKNIVTGEGGAVVTDNGEVYERIVFLRDCGTTNKKKFSEVPWYYHTVSKGFSLLMPDICAAIGLVQLRKINDINKLRAENATYLSELLSEINGIILPKARDYVTTNHHLYTIRLEDPNVRNKFIREMIRHSVHCDVHYLPLNMHPFYRELGYAEGEFPVSESVYKSLVTLPMYPSLTEGEMNYVADSVKKSLRCASSG